MELRYPDTIELICERDWTLLNSLLVAKNQVDAVRARIGRGFSFSSIAVRNRACAMYFDEKDKKEFIRFSEERCMQDPAYVGTICSELRRITDEFTRFMQDPSITPERVREFLSLHFEHHAYHIAVLWAGHFTTQDPREELHAMRDMLFETRKYNERILPSIDEWLTQHTDPIELLTPEELMAYAETSSLPHDDELRARKEYAYFYATEDENVLLAGADAKREHKRADALVLYHSQNFKDGILSGIGVSNGTARGVVRVVEEFEEFKDLKEGEILVAPITLPKYTEWIRKAGAIVTNEGGMLNHAAILSREYGIPCVSGTNVATRVFSTGDRVEVDAGQGTVTILS